MTLIHVDLSTADLSTGYIKTEILEPLVLPPGHVLDGKYFRNSDGIIYDVNEPLVESEGAHPHNVNRTLLYHLLLDSGEEEAARRWAECRAPGKGFVGECSDDKSHDPVFLPCSCEQRICPTCARNDTARFLNTYEPIITDLIKKHRNCTRHYDKRWATGKGYTLKHITLTTNLSGGLDVSLEQAKANQDKLASWIKELAAHPELMWCEKPAGFLRSIELGESGHKLHAHLIAFVPYIKQDRLSEIWNQVSGCPIVYVRGIYAKNGRTLRDAMVEVLKYVVKVSKFEDDIQADQSVLNSYNSGFSLEEVLLRCHLLFKGKRRIQAYGSFYGQEHEEKPKLCCKSCGNSLVWTGEETYRNRVTNNVLDDLKAGGELLLHLIPANNSPEIQATQHKFWDDPPKLRYD